MRRLLIVLLVPCVVACGSRGLSKGPDDGSAGTNNTSTNGASNGSTGSGTNSQSTNNVTPNNTTGPQNSSNGTTTVTCEVLTAETTDGYCNLQAICDDASLLVECELGDDWTCYCGDQVLTYGENPCASPERLAPRLAAQCG